MRPEAGKRKRRRLKKTWQSTFQEYLKEKRVGSSGVNRISSLNARAGETKSK